MVDIAEADEALIAERVSRDTLMKMEFLTGGSDGTLKDVSFKMILEDRIVEITYDSEGRMHVRPACK